MKKSILTIMWLGMMGLAAACASRPNIPEVESPQAQAFLNKCTLCHGFPHPSRHSAVEWDHYVQLMEGHMKDRGIPFDPEEKKTILDYLHRNAR